MRPSDTYYFPLHLVANAAMFKAFHHTKNIAPPVSLYRMAYQDFTLTELYDSCKMIVGRLHLRKENY